MHRKLDSAEDIILREEINKNISKYKDYIEYLNDYEAILFHKNIAECQRLTYNRDRKNVEYFKNGILIEIDFKQKIIIGLSPRKVSKEFYNQEARSFLGNRYNKYSLFR